MSFRPLVNGLSPQLVFPGSKITIRGERLGVDINDVINLWICGEDCKPFIETHTSNKIVGRVGKCPDEKDPFVIVVTKSGGEGECKMRLQITDRADPISHTEDVPLWMEENIFFQIENMGNPQDSLSPSNQMNLFGDRVPYKNTEKSSESDPSSNSFDPIRYLLNNHRDISISELQLGVDHLQLQCGQHTESDIEFVKTHIDVLLSCHETLDTVNKWIDEEETHSDGGSLTGPLATVLNDCNKCAKQLFSNILSKKDKADRIRNALNVIERFRFLFSLPDSIDKNIERKEYDIVLNDYKKAKSLFADTQVSVFQQVMNGVHGKIRAFSGSLQCRLLEPRCPLGEKKQLLKYLIEFEGSSVNDPAWDSLQKQQEQVLDYMTHSKIDFHNKILEFVTGAQIKSSRAGGASHTDENISPLMNEFVDEVCDTVTQNLPDYWALCQAYLDSSLFPEVKKPVLKQQDSFISPPPTPVHRLSIRPGDHEVEIQDLIGAVMELLNSVVRKYCIDMDLKFHSPKDYEYAKQLIDKAKPYWTPLSVKRIKVCIERLLAINIPFNCVLPSILLLNDLRRMCIKCLFENTEKNIRELYARENWQISQERGHTALPLLFQNIVLSLLATVKEVMEEIEIEGEDEVPTIEDVRSDIIDMFSDVVISFADALEHLTNIIESTEGENDPSTGDDKENVLSGSCIKTEERLVLILGNCKHTLLTIIPTLLDTFKSHGYMISSNDTSIDNKSLERYSKLERRIFDQYVTSKDVFLFGDISQFLEPNFFPWSQCNPPTVVNIYVQELALKLVMAQAELHNIEKDLLSRIIGHLLEKVTVRVCGTITNVDRFCKNGAMQARLDLMACLALFKKNMTSKCERMMGECLNSIPTNEITDEDAALVYKLLENFKKQNSVTLSCLDYCPNSDLLHPTADELELDELGPEVRSLDRTRRLESLDRVPSLRKSVLKGHGNSDSIMRRRSRKGGKPTKGLRSPQQTYSLASDL